MKVLLDTNIIIHREAGKIKNQDIGTLFKWLDRGHYTKVIHNLTVDEIRKHLNPDVVSTFSIKLQNYEIIKNSAPMPEKVKEVSKKIDTTENDIIDTTILNEVFSDRVDYLITEDKKIHKKAELLGISEKVFTIDSFLEKIYSENPELIDYKILNVQKIQFGKIDLSDSFFQSLKEDYPGFEKWFLRKYDDEAYIRKSKMKRKIILILILFFNQKND